MTADRPATEPRHMRQSINGCVTCPKRWSDHTLAEAAQGAAPLTDQRYAPGGNAEHRWGAAPLYPYSPCVKEYPHDGPCEGAAPRAEGLDAALADILRWTKPGSLFMDGTNGYSPAGPEKVARIHNRARAAFGDAPLPPSRPSDERVPEEK